MPRPTSSRTRTLASAFVALSLIGACGSDNNTGMMAEDMGAMMPPPDLTPAVPQIKHVILIAQENHTFDTYFGRYCTALTGSNPTCNTGPACCEGAPAKEPSGAMPTVLTDSANGSYDPDHTQACELAEANGGKMDRYVTGAAGCSDPRNWAIAPAALVQGYHDLANQYALADRYFQPLSGQSSANDMYFAEARFVFKDNAEIPNAQGHGCWYPLKTTTRYTNRKTIADVLIGAGHSFAVYGEGYDAMVAATLCPLSFPSDCTFTPFTVPGVPNTCVYDSSDYPFQYYAQFADNAKYIKDYKKLAADLSAGTLPTFAFVKGSSYHTEHPNFGNTISFGVKFVKQIVDAVQASANANDTLILVTWDEGGGFFDHISPPGINPVDNQPYGTRVPLLAIGRFAKKNYVSHLQMEHSSIVKFLEYNFTGSTGQLGARDTVVNNLGSMLDPTQTGIVIPDN